MAALRQWPVRAMCSWDLATVHVAERMGIPATILGVIVPSAVSARAFPGISDQPFSHSFSHFVRVIPICWVHRYRGPVVRRQWLPIRRAITWQWVTPVSPRTGFRSGGGWSRWCGRHVGIVVISVQAMGSRMIVSVPIRHKTTEAIAEVVGVRTVLAVVVLPTTIGASSPSYPIGRARRPSIIVVVAGYVAVPT